MGMPPAMALPQHLARTAPAGLDLVEDEEDPVLVAALAHALHEALGRHEVAALALHGLHDDAGHLVWRHQIREELVYLAQAVGGALLRVEAGGAEVLLRVGSKVDARHAGLVGVAVLGVGARHAHGTHGAPVEGAREGDDAGALGVGTHQLEGGVSGLGSAVGKERAAQLSGGDLGDALCQPQGAGEVHHVEGAVDELVHLLLDGILDGLVPVAKGVHGDARHEVQVLLAVDVPHVGTLAVVDHEVGRLGERRAQVLLVVLEAHGHDMVPSA